MAWLERAAKQIGLRMPVLPWRRGVEERLATLERRLDMVDENVQKQWDLMKDVVSSAESTLDRLNAAVGYLRNHPDPTAQALADDIAREAQELQAKIAAVAASGDISQPPAA